jgi:hypothetical protein
VYVILTSKAGKFTTESGPGLRPLETYEYIFYGEVKAQFVIAELLAADIKVRVVDAAPPYSVNDVPAKFLEKFGTVEAARRELDHLVTFGTMQTSLRLLADPA